MISDPTLAGAVKRKGELDNLMVFFSHIYIDIVSYVEIKNFYHIQSNGFISKVAGD